MTTEDSHICSFDGESKASIEQCKVCGHRWERQDSGDWIKQNRADRRWRHRVWRAHFRRQTREADKRG